MKQLNCSVCRAITPHEYDRDAYRQFSYYSGKECKTIDADGIKEIWFCLVCQTRRIYGAPEEKKILIDPRKAHKRINETASI